MEKSTIAKLLNCGYLSSNAGIKLAQCISQSTTYQKYNAFNLIKSYKIECVWEDMLIKEFGKIKK